MTELAIKIIDQNGINIHSLELVVPSLQLTVRELIRQRVFNDFTSAKIASDNFRQNAKEIRNSLSGNKGFQFIWMDSPGNMDTKATWDVEAEKACHNFKSGKFLLIAAGRQLVDLDEEIILSPEETVQFIKLIPLVGG